MLPRFCENKVKSCVLLPSAYFSPSLYYDFLEHDKKKSLIRQSEHEVLRKSGPISIQLSSAAVGRFHRDALSGGVTRERHWDEINTSYFFHRGDKRTRRLMRLTTRTDKYASANFPEVNKYLEV